MKRTLLKQGFFFVAVFKTKRTIQKTEVITMKKLMKFIAHLGVTTTITAVASYFTVCTLKASSMCNQSFYPETGMVTNANENLITVVCQNGNIFKFKDNIILRSGLPETFVQ